MKLTAIPWIHGFNRSRFLLQAVLRIETNTSRLSVQYYRNFQVCKARWFPSSTKEGTYQVSSHSHLTKLKPSISGYTDNIDFGE